MALILNITPQEGLLLLTRVSKVKVFTGCPFFSEPKKKDSKNTGGF